jgi:hypothetical protein
MQQKSPRKNRGLFCVIKKMKPIKTWQLPLPGFQLNPKFSLLDWIHKAFVKHQFC